MNRSSARKIVARPSPGCRLRASSTRSAAVKWPSRSEIISATARRGSVSRYPAPSSASRAWSTLPRRGGVTRPPPPASGTSLPAVRRDGAPAGPAGPRASARRNSAGLDEDDRRAAGHVEPVGEVEPDDRAPDPDDRGDHHEPREADGQHLRGGGRA